MQNAMQIGEIVRWSHAPIPARAEVGLKPEHYDVIVATSPDVRWFEVHPENYMGNGGAPHHFLSRVLDNYPVSFQGVGLSIGSADELDKVHLARLAGLTARRAYGKHSPTTPSPSSAASRSGPFSGARL